MSARMNAVVKEWGQIKDNFIIFGTNWGSDDKTAAGDRHKIRMNGESCRHPFSNHGDELLILIVPNADPFPTSVI